MNDNKYIQGAKVKAKSLPRQPTAKPEKAHPLSAAFSIAKAHPKKGWAKRFMRDHGRGFYY